MRCIWYQIDAGDDDVATFFHYLGRAAASHRAPDAEPLPDLTPEFAFGVASFSRSYFRELFAGLESPFVLVLDNYQEVADTSLLHEIVRDACEEMPEGGHIVLVSRNCCPQSLARLRANNALTIIGADDLTLSPEETQGIAKLQGVKLLSDSAAVALHARIGGWAAGLMLALEGTGRNDPNRPGLDQPKDAIFEYFAGEVFRKMDALCADLLLQIALLPKMSPRTVCELTGHKEAEALLRELVRKNYFTVQHGSDSPLYQFHPLFRQFLLNQAAIRYSADELLSLQRSAAKILMAEGDAEAAVEILEQASDWEKVSGVILEFAPTLMAQGRIATLASWIGKLPESLIQSNPWLLYWCGIGKVFTSPLESQPILEEAYRRFDVAADIVGLALSWSALMDAIFHQYIDLYQMDRWIGEFETKLASQMEMLPAPIRARVTHSLFVALSFRQPNHPRMPATIERVREMIRTGNDMSMKPMSLLHLGVYLIWQGEHAEAELVLGKFNPAPEQRDTQLPMHVVNGYLCEATLALHTGMEERCLNAVTAGLAIAERSGIRLFDAIFLCHGAAISLNSSRPERADKFLAEFERLEKDFPFFDRGYYCATAAWSKFYAGHTALALQLCDSAIHFTEAKGAPYFIAVWRLGYGLMLHLCGRSEEALHHLQAGRAVGESIANRLIEYVYQLFSAYVAFDQHREHEALAHLRQGMRLGQEHGYMHFFFFPPKVIALLCLNALEAGIEASYVRALIARNKLTPDPSWPLSEAWPWAARIYTLGRFSVVKDGAPLRFTGKAQKKPLELLKALIAFGGRNVPETKLQDALWPEAEGDSAAQALATTLFRLRKLVGDNLIERGEGRLTLDATACWVDCWALERLFTGDTNDEAVRLEKITKLYQGLFLDGEDDAAWAMAMREKLHAKVKKVRANFVVVDAP
ncbi:MAG: hypothetical protein Q8L39_14030 [Burkholderiales bacterium]|nr:hypothetical protein [Burkholderiales bacterium]